MSIYTPDRTPYVYAIAWTGLNTAYVGVRYGRGCHPSDLWKSYFTSSRYVAEFRREHGEPDVVDIIDVFLNEQQAQACEQEILVDFGLAHDPAFLNKGAGSGPIWSDELKQVTARKTREAADRKSPSVIVQNKRSTLRELARQHGLNISLLKRRYLKGVRGEQLILPPGHEYRPYLYNGERHNASSLAEIVGITRQGMLLRLKTMTVEEALAKPRSKI